jgi:hypothetical protein
VATPGAITLMQQYAINPADLLDHHVTGDWDELCDEDRAENERAVCDGGRVFSAYGEGAARLWVITEADRSATTILRPEDY